MPQAQYNLHRSKPIEQIKFEALYQSISTKSTKAHSLTGLLEPTL